MSTVLEIEQCFNAARDRIAKLRKDERMRQLSNHVDAAELAEQDTIYSLLEMGLFVLESVVVDIKRVANVLDGGDPNSHIANDVDGERG